MNIDREAKNFTHPDMVDHVFLHRKLEAKPENLHRTELALVDALTKAIESFKSEIFPTVIQQLFVNIKQLYCDNELNPEEISKQLTNMKLGEMLGIYVRAQNCGLLIHMTNDDEMTLSTFSASLPNKMIYGENINGDIQVDYPMRAIVVKSSTMLKSEEFGKQIHYLNSTQMDRAMAKSEKCGREFSEGRDVPIPMYVSQWLLAAVSNRFSVVNEECRVISKKMRDEVISDKGRLSFRRSGFYTALKVFLQLGLTIELGDERGKFLYKLVMLKFMCHAFNAKTIDVDISVQIMAKMARRMDKIESYSQSFNELGSDLVELKNKILGSAGKVLKDVRNKLNEEKSVLLTNEVKKSCLEPMSKLQFERDVIHQIPKTLEYIDFRNREIVSKTVNSSPEQQQNIRHQWENVTSPEVDKIHRVSGEIETSQLLADIENWIVVTLNGSYRNMNAEYLRELATVYMSKAQTFYRKREHCIGYSKMVLVMLKIIQVMERIAIEEHELLRNHSSGINPRIIENLLLPSQFDMKIAMELQIYFEDRNIKAQYPGLLEENKISTSSFSARFAASDSGMQRLRQEIQEMSKVRMAEKEVEWQKARVKIQEMRNRFYGMTCEYGVSEWTGKSYHSNTCTKHALKRAIRDYKIDLYEKPLKPQIHNQNAVVFELLLPPKIGCLRDVLYLFVAEHQEPLLSKLNIHGKWTEYGQISGKRDARSNPKNVFLGSTTVLYEKANYNRGKHPDSVSSVDDLIVDNGYDCTLFGGERGSASTLPIDKSQQSIKKYVTFSVEIASVYSSLQWTLGGTSHTQNSVLTKQCECPEKLSVPEFVNFGSFRADGHRLQLRNLYRVFETEGLSFESQSVLALVMQSLWEAGPLDASRSQWYRESHEDFADGVFAMAMIDLLEKYVNQQKSNWKHPLKLTVAAIIAVRIFEINSDEANADRIVKLLLLIREIVIDWIAEIVGTIGKCHDEKSRADVYANFVNVAVCGIFTYSVSRHHIFFDKIFTDGPEHSSLFAWLHFMVTIKNNNLVQSDRNGGITHLLIRMVYNIGLNAEAKLRSLIENNPNEVRKFVRIQTPDLPIQHNEPIQHNDSAPQIIFMHVRCEESRNYVQIDLVSGNFSVNNNSATRLPESITSNKCFLRVFGSTVFEVQPSDRSKSRSQFTTVHQYNGNNYTFRIIEQLVENHSHWWSKSYRTSLTITEQHPDGTKSELIPSEYLTGEIPHMLVENHSHWWDKRRQIIEFRPKTFESHDFSSPNGVQYELNVSTCQLMHLKTRKLLLDICSDSYKRIVKFFSRVEQQNYIHVLMDAPAKAKVHLMRMNLKFLIDCTKQAPCNTYDVESNEYCGMRVRLNQAFGTLNGLRNGLFLESIPTVNKTHSKLLVVPHGEVNIMKADRRVSVHIDLLTPSLRTPTFFIYRVDNECRYIKADNHPGWLYLAYLHAVTSHPLPDPFTRMTGTERALQILQSARVWSSSPYDAESVSTLRMIAALTPVRTFYPPRKDLKVMQHIQWPQGITSIAAQDTYLPIVQKLIADSQRLSQLYFQNEKIEIKANTYWPLNERAHARQLPYFPNCNVSQAFINPRNTITHFQATEEDKNISVVRQLSVAYDENSFVIPNTFGNSIYHLLTNDKKSLVGISRDLGTAVVDFGTSNKLSDMWIRLYDCARLGQLTAEHFHLILSFLAFEGEDINQLFLLQAIAANANEFKEIHPPAVELYVDPTKHQFEGDKVKQIIQSTEIGEWNYLMKQPECLDQPRRSLLLDESRKQVLKNEYEKEIASVTQRLMDFVKMNWQRDDIGNVTDISTDVLDVKKSINEIKRLLQHWNNNRKLLLFTEKVEAKLKDLNGMSKFSPDEWPVFNVGVKLFPKYTINFEEKLSRNFKSAPSTLEDDIERARKIFVEKTEDNERTLDDWWQRFLEISTPSNEMHLVHALLYPRMNPSLILPKLLQPICDRQKFMIGAIAVMTTRQQRTQRIGRFEHQPQMEMMLRRERENKPHFSWMPHERPEWLLFEIEMDLSIRCIQVEIAERMIDPPGNHHSVMQLNMGEGKTAVIVPIAAATLANGEQLCTVTVLKSLFQTNLRSLRQCLGGMLNRRMYTFPCRRDMQIEAVASNLLSIYEECKRECGVVMTLPENRLSFQLKIYETARKKDTTNATHFLNVHKWLNQNARHILDESDAILDAKYQLIYTVGAQLPPDAGALRWKIIQAVLKRVPFHMRELFKIHGDQAVEFNVNYKIDGESANGSEVFQPCRLLNESIYNELMDRLIDEFLDGKLNISFPDTTLDLRVLIRSVLRDKTVRQEEHEKLMRQFEDTKSAQEIILILSGLLKFEVLQLSLTKRYRVNYGVNLTGRRKMAVPFRAKDVAAEMTEFGHPDVAICLTHFSYYYSGLTDAQLYEIFDLLALAENPREIYDEWMQLQQTSIPYSGVNLSDPLQRKTLFRSLRFNMHVIDYWLSMMVFPREAKIFESKLMCSAWDLCTEHLEHICTGFSGTNDTKLLLPMPIVQNDLPKMEKTNEEVREKLLREENNCYRRLPSNVSGKEILHELIADKIPVLLDAGALMLELDNEQVAREWLSMESIENYDAGIYFSKDDILLTVDRNDVITEFEYSVYRERLRRCLVYLDDVHTRGTDLKFPSGIRACVTLSGHITRDKTVQACMRMRMLGEGHTLSFWASHEADIGIRELNGLNRDCSVSTSQVIEYICDNSRAFEKEGLVHWSAAGLNYTQKLAAHKCFEESMVLSELSERCTDQENTPLIELYGAKEVQPLTVITQNHFDRLALIYHDQPIISEWINATCCNVVSKLKTNVPEMVRFTLLDQEHERELENELEEQRQISRPPSAPPFIPHFQPLLQEIFIHGRSHNSFVDLIATRDLRKLPLAFEKTKLFSIMESQVTAWDDNIFVTADFSSVTSLATADGVDEFLRPVWWIAQIIEPNDSDVFVLLSTFECNSLLPTFRGSKRTVLHMFCPKLSMTHSNLLNDTQLQLPANLPKENVALAKAIQITMFAGSMYFNNQDEETAYCNFMGFIPRPRDKDCQQAFEEGAIKSNGYVPFEHRKRFSNLTETCRFKKNPDKIAIGIIDRRHGYLSAKSHVSLLLVEGKRARWDN